MFIFYQFIFKPLDEHLFLWLIVLEQSKLFKNFSFIAATASATGPSCNSFLLLMLSHARKLLSDFFMRAEAVLVHAANPSAFQIYKGRQKTALMVLLTAPSVLFKTRKGNL